jgi:hypothetical protein
LRHQKIQALKDLPTLKDNPIQKREVNTLTRFFGVSVSKLLARATSAGAVPAETAALLSHIQF